MENEIDMGKMTRTAISLNKAEIGAKRTPARYFTEGEYEVEMGDIKIVTRRKDKVQLFVVETTILKSEGEKAQPTGRCTWTVKLGLDAAPGNIKELLVALSDIDPQNVTAVEAADEDWDQVMELALDETQPFKGKKIRVSAMDQKTREGGNFVRCYFAPIEAEQAAA